MGVVTYGRYFHLDKSLYHHEQRTLTLEQQLLFGVCLYQAQSKMEDKKSFLERLMDLVWFLGQYLLFLYSNLKHFVQQLCCHAMSARLLICLSEQSEIGIKPNQTETQTHIQQIHTIQIINLIRLRPKHTYNTTQLINLIRLKPKHTYNTIQLINLI